MNCTHPDHKDGVKSNSNKRFCSVKAGEKFIRKLKNEYKEHVISVFKVVPAGD